MIAIKNYFVSQITPKIVQDFSKSCKLPEILRIPERITCNISQTRTALLLLIQHKSLYHCRYVTFLDSAFAS